MPLYDLTTSIRYDRSLQADEPDGPLPFFLLKYHYDRLVQAADLHGWEYAKASLSYDFLKTTCEKTIQAHEDNSGTTDPYKIRVLLTEEGFLTATVLATTPLDVAGDPFSAARLNPEIDTTTAVLRLIWSIYLDTQPTPSSLFTKTKSTHRDHYDAARSRVGLPPFAQATTPEDVLLYNTEGEITESSVSNVALWRNGKWLTPPFEAGCLTGTVRRWLLERGLVEEAAKGVLMRDTVKSGDWVLLFNAVSGCRLGRIVG